MMKLHSFINGGKRPNQKTKKKLGLPPREIKRIRSELTSQTIIEQRRPKYNPSYRQIAFYDQQAPEIREIAQQIIAVVGLVTNLVERVV